VITSAAYDRDWRVFKNNQLSCNLADHLPDPVNKKMSEYLNYGYDYGSAVNEPYCVRDVCLAFDL